MVGILIVSHNKKIAEGAKELASEMIQQQIPMAVAGGLDDGSMGTDTDLIYEKLKELEIDDGVIILTDVGSAIMSVELAIEKFPAVDQDKFRIANAPLVEGAIIGAVEASLGNEIEDIMTKIESEAILKKRS